MATYCIEVTASFDIDEGGPEMASMLGDAVSGAVLGLGAQTAVTKVTEESSFISVQRRQEDDNDE